MIAMNRPIASTLLATLLLFPLGPTSQAQAASADRKLPLEIEADRKHTNYKEGEALYEGRVIIRQGQLLLQADKAIIRLRDGQLDHAMLEGHPVTYQDRDDAGQPIHGEARRMDYQALDEIIILSGQAQIERAGDTLASERIVYNLKSEVVDAGAGGGDRVRMTLQPRNLNEGKKP